MVFVRLTLPLLFSFKVFLAILGPVPFIWISGSAYQVPWKLILGFWLGLYWVYMLFGGNSDLYDSFVIQGHILFLHLWKPYLLSMKFFFIEWRISSIMSWYVFCYFYVPYILLQIVSFQNLFSNFCLLMHKNAIDIFIFCTFVTLPLKSWGILFIYLKYYIE